MSSARRILYLAVGSVSLGLGILGIVVPVLPTTPFLLLSAACYARGSRRLHDRLLASRFLGSYIRNYREGRGIPLRTKLVTIGLLWLMLGYSALAIVGAWWLRTLLVAIGLGVTIHVGTRPTYRP